MLSGEANKRTNIINLDNNIYFQWRPVLKKETENLLQAYRVLHSILVPSKYELIGQSLMINLVADKRWKVNEICTLDISLFGIWKEQKIIQLRTT